MTFVQFFRLLLTIVLLAFLPLQAWAGIGAPVAGNAAVWEAGAHVAPAPTVEDVALASASDAAGLADLGNSGPPADSHYPADTSEPSPPGADFAEQLLPPPPLRVAVHDMRGALPRYAGMTLPDPDLPRLPRPPRG
ncbi:hypothetical protein [Cupriavidus plantarum]|uniref:Uncharacterized protein n=1 Tax=Cupriavidus plantarum TaxID=942865 RepID=A0A316ELE4_9BURK|nr:hypothetical protein [Cupriavidus plantarum]PWK31948.1 hypothetical protein C7419_10889 [Cupriavidus plantarum]